MVSTGPRYVDRPRGHKRAGLLSPSSVHMRDVEYPGHHPTPAADPRGHRSDPIPPQEAAHGEAPRIPEEVEGFPPAAGSHDRCREVALAIPQCARGDGRPARL